MEPIPFERGRVVYATAGRDRGRYFIVLDVVDGTQPGEKQGFALISDGRTRKLAHPKRKKCKHLRCKPVRMDALDTLQAANMLKDSDLRNFLEANGFGLAGDIPLKEED